MKESYPIVSHIVQDGKYSKEVALHPHASVSSELIYRIVVRRDSKKQVCEVLNG